jgi:hypothetical protein
LLSHQNFSWIFQFSHVCCTPYPAHILILIVFGRNTSYEAPHLQLYPAFCYLIPLGSRFSPQHPVLKHPKPAFFPICDNYVSQAKL